MERAGVPWVVQGVDTHGAVCDPQTQGEHSDAQGGNHLEL